MGPTSGAFLLAVLQTADALGLHAAGVRKHGTRHGRHRMSYRRVYRNEGCAPLDNMGSHFTIDVEVGTPGQRFSVVADTGSNTLIVPSCLCQERGQCPQDGSERCFVGTNRSSSFMMERTGAEPTSLVLAFGSGQIRGIVAKEHVKVGQVEAFLDDGMLLMTDRSLNAGGRFEGILGLGVPQPPEDPQQMQRQQEEALEKMGYADRMAAEAAGISAAPPQRSYPKGFLEQAKVDRFSVCFNDGEGGVLGLGGNTPKTSHGGIGKQHWGLDFRGISVGNETLPSQTLFCTPETTNMTEVQRTACGAIPDSGTTTILGPADQVLKLMEGICDGWDRCRNNYTAMQEATTAAENDMKKIYGFNPFNLKNAVRKTDILQAILADCESWMDEKGGLSELPPLHFHVQGSNGTKQTLTLPGHLYILETPKKLLAQRGDVTGKACIPALGEFEYQTRANGPVWIFGTPLFYQYVVGYDVSTTPPSIAFSDQDETPCGNCDPTVQLWASPASDFEDDDWEEMLLEKKETHRPIRVNGLPRMPRIDTSKPL
jgi:hypothetical protein